MELLDLFLGALLVYGVVRGIWNGFFIELASLLSLLLGIWAAIKFSYVMRSILQDHAEWNPRTIQVIAFVLTFILVVIGITILAKVLSTVVSAAGLGIFNKIFGGVFGMVKMALMISVAL
ncbi:MAG TPA: CvpA family protein, partial [Flavobacterium sp.]|nr:CvpA family protein [Flavobacterium sp.]